MCQNQVWKYHFFTRGYDFRRRLPEGCSNFRCMNKHRVLYTNTDIHFIHVIIRIARCLIEQRTFHGRVAIEFDHMIRFCLKVIVVICKFCSSRSNWKQNASRIRVCIKGRYKFVILHQPTHRLNLWLRIRSCAAISIITRICTCSGCSPSVSIIAI